MLTDVKKLLNLTAVEPADCSVWVTVGDRTCICHCTAAGVSTFPGGPEWGGRGEQQHLNFQEDTCSLC